jgi:iron-sulfur cluster repair protein YtfE (RIC family)
MADVTKMLEQDHREAEDLFAKIKETNGAARAGLVTKLAGALKLHMEVEEKIVYPAIAKQVDGGDDMVDEATTEHEGARKALADVENLSPNEPGFDGALEMLEAGISHHVEEEEEEVFPKFRESVSSDELNELGDEVAAAKEANGA